MKPDVDSRFLGVHSSDPDTSVRASDAEHARMQRAGQAARRSRAGEAKADQRHLTTLSPKRLAPVLSFLVVGGLAVVVGLPAYATLENPDVVSAAPALEESQSVEARGGAMTAGRDGISSLATKAATPLHANVRYTNNPNGIIQWPFPYFVPISDMFGEREAPCEGCSTAHAGTDFDANEGDPVQAIADGVVTKVVNVDNGGDGLYVNISHNVNGKEFLSRYCHLEPGSITVSEGQVVTVTQIVGNVGVSGTSTGSHLHFELHVGGVPVDPFAWLSANAG